MNKHPKEQVHIGSKLKERRKSLKITQTELAQFIGCTPQQIQKYEGGQSRVSVSTFLKVCEFLNTPPSYFLPRKAFEDSLEVKEEVDLEEKLLECFRAVNNKKVKERIINLVEVLVANPTEE